MERKSRDREGAEVERCSVRAAERQSRDRPGLEPSKLSWGGREIEHRLKIVTVESFF